MKNYIKHIKDFLGLIYWYFKPNHKLHTKCTWHYGLVDDKIREVYLSDGKPWMYSETDYEIHMRFLTNLTNHESWEVYALEVFGFDVNEYMSLEYFRINSNGTISISEQGKETLGLMTKGIQDNIYTAEEFNHED